MPETDSADEVDLDELELEWMSDEEWLAQQFDALTDEVEVLSPSAWAEKKRYLPAALTGLPGFYRFAVAPYLREIVDCLAVDNPIREVAVMKGSQVGVTVGVLENFLGYAIDHVKTAPTMMVTADAELAKQRLETNIIPMLRHSGLDELITSSDEGNKRKTGKTAKRLEWVGGGYLIPYGAKSANKLRSFSIQYLLRDEVDGWPDTVGKDGDPMRLSFDRTVGYEDSRKVLDLSTPLVRGTSKIEKRYAAGDQRKYHVRCLGCGHSQVLRWRHTDPDTGEVSGIVWVTKDGRLVSGSVRYRCVSCGHEHTNDDKRKLLAEDNAEWRPTAEPSAPFCRSYHLSALYSPVGMQTWESCVRKWLAAWDEEKGRARDNGLLQVFYNNVLGESFELRGEKIRFERVSSHRRAGYRFGQVPNQFAERFCGGPVMLVTAAVDVHKHELPTAVIGWCRGRRAILLDYWRWEGDTEQLDDPGTWEKLRNLIEQGEYVGDDGKRYRVQLTLVDSSYRTDTVYRFAAEYEAGVAPIKGRTTAPKSASMKHFSSFTTPQGTEAYSVTVDLYKDRWAAALRREWDRQDLQPQPFFNAPLDAHDDQLRELTREVKREKIDQRTGLRVGVEWHRPSGAANELWDLLIYNDTALDLIAWDVSRRQLGLDFVSMEAFFDLCLEQRPFFAED